MKTGRKWMIVAQLALILTIAAEVSLFAASLAHVSPLIESWCHDLEAPFIGGFKMTATLSHIVTNYIWWFLFPIVGGWGLFEWKCHSKNKPIIRLSGLSMVSLSMCLFLATFCIPMAVNLIQLPRHVNESQINLTLL